jgi:hypothetical protein
MVNANIGMLELSNKESVSYFKQLKNLDKCRHTNGPNPSSLPLENSSYVNMLPLVSASLLKVIRPPTCGVIIVTRTTTTRLIAEQSPNSNSKKRLALMPEMDREMIALKRQFKP